MDDAGGSGRRATVEIGALLYDLETELLKEIAALLGRGAVGTAEWKLEKLRRLGVVSNYATDLMARYRARIEARASAEVERAALDEALRVDREALAARRAGADVREAVPVIQDQALRATIETWQRSAVQGADLAMATMARNLGPVYTDTINRVALSVITGATDSHKALVTACREWAEAGIPSIIDKAGRQWTTEAYANAVIRSNVRRVASETAWERMDEYGADLIEVSSHAGARPLCAPYQGRIYSRSGKSEKYPPLSSTSYGEAAGLFGINCGHVAYPFFEGVSIQRNAPTENPEENARIYRESQEQRARERSIRAAKRELDVMKALGDERGIKQAKALVADRQAAMREFIDATGRTRRYGREQVYQ